MRIKHHPRTLIISMLIATTLTGCGDTTSNAPEENDPDSVVDHPNNNDETTSDPNNSPIPLYGKGYGLSEVRVLLNDNRTVTCVSYNVHSRGGVSCDWANAK